MFAFRQAMYHKGFSTPALHGFPFTGLKTYLAIGAQLSRTPLRVNSQHHLACFPEWIRTNTLWPKTIRATIAPPENKYQWGYWVADHAAVTPLLIKVNRPTYSKRST
jgi:hypothetical protein